jgi:predicted nucleic acid-binding protein
MVAAVCGWHEHHARAARELDRRLGHGETLTIAAPALVETYAVLTRLPPPHRLAPAESLALLEANFVGPDVELAALDGEGYRRLLRRAPEQDVAGGATYDAVIVACALAAQVIALLTFNERQFRPLAPATLAIVVPG